MLTGFARTNPQHTVNTPLYGLDNWIYLAHAGPAEAIIYKDLFGDRGHPLTWPEHPDRPALDPRGRGVRLRIDEGVGRAALRATRSSATASTAGDTTSPTTTRTTRGTR